ncbi:hypothetical protein F4777DRAFT_592443 [Nemania sp. FL0916]|nr:hypothetical protein F4777DRAFT_592443 [Nemania sp. FL0916]
MSELTENCRSLTKYHFDEEHADDIVKTLAYHPRDYRFYSININDEELPPTREAIGTAFELSKHAGKSNYLDKLPVELRVKVLLQLDFHSCFRFRQTSLRSRQFVDSLPEYQRVALHGAQLVYALYRTRLATDISLSTIDNLLCTQNCAHCGKFGAFVSLLNQNRCCLSCLQTKWKAQLYDLSTLQGYFKVTSKDVRKMMKIDNLEGIYGVPQMGFPAGHKTLYSLHQASLSFERRSKQQKFKVGKPANYMGLCQLPFYYDKGSKKIEHGFLCAGCNANFHKKRGTRRISTNYDRCYTRDGFLRHFRWCVTAQRLWEESDGGNKPPRNGGSSASTGGALTLNEDSLTFITGDSLTINGGSFTVNY